MEMSGARSGRFVAGRRWVPCAALALLLASPSVASLSDYTVDHQVVFEISRISGYDLQGQWQWGAFADARGQDGHTTDGRQNVDYFLGGSQDFESSSAQTADAHAQSETSFQVDSNGAGFNHIAGMAQVDGPLGYAATASSDAETALAFFTINPRARVYWTPTWTTDRGDGAQSVFRDTLSVSATNMGTGEVLSTTMLDIGLDLGQGGSSTCVGGNLSFIGGDHGSFFFENEGMYGNLAQGHLRLTWDHGVVTSSDDNYIYDGLLPPVGGVPNVSLHIIGGPPGQLILDFSPHGSSDAGYYMAFDMKSHGSAQAVPEPGGWMAVGVGLLAIGCRKARWPR